MKDKEKLQISWDDLKHEKVEKKLKEQEAVSSTQSHYQQSNVVIPEKAVKFKFIYNALFYLSLFGALGGLMGWGCGAFLQIRPDDQAEANKLITEYENTVQAKLKVQASQEEIEKATQRTLDEGKNNPYFQIYRNMDMTDDQKTSATTNLLERDRAKDFIASLLFFGVSGITIAVMLAIAESVIERNINGVIVYGSISAVVGLAGGIVVAMLVNRLQEQFTPQQEVQTDTSRMILQTICWGTLGLFLAATPGLILRNGKRLMIGMLGGLIGGVIGGVIYVPLQNLLNSESVMNAVGSGWLGQLIANDHASRLIAIVSIGLFAGLASGIIENVVKTGWLKVESGVIAGKQFVLYRNPTFIGSHPMSHIYLFNDPHVGRRHACVHKIGNGYEIEDLPLGTRTYVNGKPVSRLRLKTGDKVQIGSTQFHFQERAKSS